MCKRKTKGSSTPIGLPGGGGGHSTNVYTGRLRPKVQPLIYHFSRKRYPFRIPSIDKWYPFHKPCSRTLQPF